MKIDLYLVRHAQSLQPKGVFQPPQLSLSPIGLKQADKLAQHLKKFHFDIILSSQLQRAVQTAEIIAKKHSLEVKSSQQLDEWRKPSELFGLDFDHQLAKKIITIFQKNRQKPDFIYSDDESFNQVLTRAKQFLSSLAQKNKNSSVLAVTHIHLIRLMILSLLFKDKLTQAEFWQSTSHLPHDHTGISHLCFEADKGWQLINWNDNCHL
ncbi:MAG: hypothetical protein ACD_83C00151G0002 [uncultured bacterium]|nr:MAG: hypothetical protein ACD_83C00151G0002 [uncultured bacterium]